MSFTKKHTEESRKKMSLVKMGHKVSKETRNKMSEAKLGKKLSIETRKKISKLKKCSWLKDADEISYFSFHHRLRSYYGSDLSCEHCGNSNSVEFASISKKALHDFNDYMPLCRSCHRKYDKTHEKRERDIYGRFI